MTLRQQIEAAGITSEQLDSLVHDAASRIASRVNNEGLAEQLILLDQAGFSDEEIADELGFDLT